MLHGLNLVQGIIQENQCEKNKIIEIVQILFPMSYTHLLNYVLPNAYLFYFFEQNGILCLLLQV